VRGRASKGKLVLEPFPGEGRVRKEEIIALINKRDTAVRRIVKRGRTPYVSLKESWVLQTLRSPRFFVESLPVGQSGGFLSEKGIKIR
jgi:hypothetical protein